jgi:alpha-glucosidase
MNPIATLHRLPLTVPDAAFNRPKRPRPAHVLRRALHLLLVVLAGSGWFGSGSMAAEPYSLSSPGGQIRVSIQVPVGGISGRPEWSLSFRERPILSHCGLGLQTVEDGELLAGARLLGRQDRSVDQRIPVWFGKSESAQDRYREARFHLETSRHCKVDLIFRCYDDGVAFRYDLAAEDRQGSVVIADERTSFGVEGNPTAYAQYLENYTTSHEHNVTTVRAQDLRSDLLDLPLTLSWSDGTYAALTEASLRHYAGMSLRRTAGLSNQVELTSQLTPRPDGTKVAGPLPLQTPWRVVLIAERPGALLESSTLYCLNDPPAFQDRSWIKPGKITFSWWNGDVYDGRRDLPILSVPMAKRYIDFCARTGIATHSLTSDEVNVSPWYFQSTLGVAPGPDTDVTRTRADFDLETIRQYAASKKVRLWTWVHQGALRGRVEAAFTAFEKMGWSGMMVDFFDHDDQESVEHAEAILKSAARHHLMIHFHGIWKPTGWQRTYPNLMNHEGALNLEYLKWSDRCTPEHDLMMASTRLIAGPMDYHLGGFRAVTRAKFQPHNIAPNVLGTRCHQLGLYVCYDNPNPMVADYPTAYEGQPGFDFVQQVPTWWDETRVVIDRIGEVLITARRKGPDWYLGGISAGAAREITVPLGFLGSGSYRARLWVDAPDAHSEPNHLVTEDRILSPREALPIRLAPDGGFVAHLLPAR